MLQISFNLVRKILSQVFPKVRLVPNACLPFCALLLQVRIDFKMLPTFPEVADEVPTKYCFYVGPAWITFFNLVHNTSSSPRGILLRAKAAEGYTYILLSKKNIIHCIENENCEIKLKSPNRNSKCYALRNQKMINKCTHISISSLDAQCLIKPGNVSSRTHSCCPHLPPKCAKSKNATALHKPH